jgi:putative inorganic carbon (hco3(-)) transporter
MNGSLLRIPAAFRETEHGDGASPLAAYVAALGVAMTAFVVYPGHAGAYRLSKWGMSGFTLLLLCASLWFTLRRSCVARVPREKKLVLAAVSFVLLAVVLPAASTTFPEAHRAGALRLLTGLCFAYGTALAVAAAPAARERSAALVVFAGGLSAVLVLMQALGSDVLKRAYFETAEFRAPGSFGNPNWAAAFLAPLVPVALGLARSAGRRTTRRALYVTLALLVAGTLATLSKGGALALAAGLAAFWWLDRRLTRALRWSSIVALACLGVAVVGGGLTSGYLDQLSWTRGRLFLWKAALLLVARHPVTGVGLGGFVPAYPGPAAVLIAGDPETFMPLGSIRFAHNDLIQVAAEAGLPTAVCFVLLLLCAFDVAFRARDELLRGAGAGLAGFAVYGLGDSPLELPATAWLFWLLLGWLMAAAAAPGSAAARPISMRHRYVRMAALLALTLVGGSLGAAQGVRLTLGGVLWSRGLRLLPTNERAGREGLELAVELMPEVGLLRSERARALARAGRTGEAARELAAAQRVHFEFDDLFLALDLAPQSRDRPDAIGAWARLSRRFPALVTPHYRLAMLYLERQERDPAERELNLVVANRQPTPAALAYRDAARQRLAELR